MSDEQREAFAKRMKYRVYYARSLTGFGAWTIDTVARAIPAASRDFIRVAVRGHYRPFERRRH